MKLYEFQAKRILKENGIPVPRGELATSPTEAEKIAKDIKTELAKAPAKAAQIGTQVGVGLAKEPAQAAKVSAQIGAALAIERKQAGIEEKYFERKLVYPEPDVGATGTIVPTEQLVRKTTPITGLVPGVISERPLEKELKELKQMERTY